LNTNYPTFYPGYLVDDDSSLYPRACNSAFPEAYSAANYANFDMAS
jgi:hypothetical protein